MWTVMAGTREVVFVAAPGPNGRILLRANGRLVTAPIAPEELEREFAFEGMRFRFTRDGDALQVESIGDDVVPDRPSEPLLSTIEARWFGVAFLAAALAALVAMSVPGLPLSPGDLRFFRLLRVALFVNALMLGVTGIVSLWRLWPDAILRKAFAGVPWLAVGSLVPAAMITDRVLHRQAHENLGWIEASAVLHKVHTIGVTGLLILGCAAGLFLYFAMTRRFPITK